MSTGKKKGRVASNEPSIEDLVELKRRTQKAHRAYSKELVAEAKALLEDHDMPQQLKAVQLKGTLQEQLNSTKKINEKSPESFVQVEGVIDAEIGEINALVISLTDFLTNKADDPTSHSRATIECKKSWVSSLYSANLTYLRHNRPCVFRNPLPPYIVVKIDLLHFSAYNYNKSATLHGRKGDINRTTVFFPDFIV